MSPSLRPSRRRARPIAPAVMLSVALLSCVCSRGKDAKDEEKGDVDATVLAAAKSFELDETLARSDLAELTRAPHPLGSERQKALAAWLISRAEQAGGKVVREPFAATVPNPAAVQGTGPLAETLDKTGANLWALGALKADAPCVVALASHYDTKIVDGLDYVGANDSGSSSSLLLQLVAFLKANAAKVETRCDIVAVWLDGEEAVLPNWSDGELRHPARIKDNTYGSRHNVGRLTECEHDGAKARCLPEDLGGQPLVALIVLDMVGSPGLKLAREIRSTDHLLATAVAGAEGLGLADAFGGAQSIEDDHIPYLEAGVPALDLIDFHNVSTWHTHGDTVETLSLASMTAAGRIALYTALTAAQ